jgi:NAD-dependent deacetylase
VHLEAATARCREAAARGGRVVVLTGAGISAESGIPTFRGQEGYWTVGAREYHPEELATHAAFARLPDEVWAWYLYRLAVCRAAAPNAAHVALAAAEAAQGDRFALVTQNVDGLHFRAGSTRGRTFPIHGEIDRARCSKACTRETWTLPADTPALGRGAPVPETFRDRLVCPRCGARSRPHVLWFDESYDEEWFYCDTVLRLAQAADLLLVVGTSASTTLPWHVVRLAQAAGATIIDVNPADNPFGAIAAATAGGAVRQPAAMAVPVLAAALGGHAPTLQTPDRIA